MTPKLDGFASAAEGLIADSQTTTVTVNNPALWPASRGDFPVTGVLAEVPLRNKRRLEGNFPDGGTVLIFNTAAQAFVEPPSNVGASFS